MSVPPPSSSSAVTTTTPSVLLPEVLGFVPQFLLDDVVDTANDAVRQAVDAMEVFLRRWAMEREDKVDADWDSTQEVEQGLVAFQTLLNSHVDIAFDYFELWSLRNIFAVPPDLPVIVPHQAGLNLEHTPDEESALVHEIRELRRKIQAQRKLERLFALAVRKSAVQRAQAERRLEKLAFLRAPQMQALAQLPDEFLAMHDAVASLPPHDPSAEVLKMPPTEPGKRPWETSQTGYLNWAIQQLLERTKKDQPGSSTSAGAFRIATPGAVAAAEEAAGDDMEDVQ
ncbi:Mis12 domain-containing protein [Phanerochaete sordida]|uniref:Mis12 domain-containing protein n=1 Tax=Phanerochaete sordida TaxID=48140 RepID=A0A9P3LLY7_9APHY|nr:Mis12 domain-containing protein [Phanerochaete sordida]